MKKKLKRMINPKKIIVFLAKKNIIKISDKFFIKMVYKEKFSKNIDLKNPKTFNEKLQWLKLYDRNPEYSQMVDKYQVKEYVAQIIGKVHIIPTLGLYKSFEEIDFEKLPNEFVIKCTHDSGSTIVCKDKNKFDISEAKKKINKSLKSNYYYLGREWPYKNVIPQILIEKYIFDDKIEELRDYKIFCFNGKVKFFKIDYDRFINHKANYYDKKLKIMEFGEEVCPPDPNKEIIIPKDIYKMFDFAEMLAKNLKFARIDFYYTNEHIYFGEITFYPASGFGKFIPEKWDKKIGEMLKI